MKTLTFITTAIVLTAINILKCAIILRIAIDGFEIFFGVYNF